MMHQKKEERRHEVNRRMRSVRCPVCGWRLMEAVMGTKTQLVIPRKGWYPDFYVKCGHCGSTVGIRKTE